jgi:transcription antitermination factor NusG
MPQLVPLSRGTDAAGACLPVEAGTFHNSPLWYALRLRSNTEWKVQEALDGLQIESFLPTWSEKVKWSDREKVVTRPLIPGYLFMRSAQREDLHFALQISGVVQILPSSMKPLAIDNEEIENLRRIATSKLRARPCEYVAGDAVMVESGPLAGMKGIVQRTRGSVHVVVSIELLRRSVRVELDADTLTRYSEPVAA